MTVAPRPRTALLVNAHARSGDRAARTVAEALRRRGLALDAVVRVRRPGRLARAVESLVGPGLERLIVGGGDGTLGTVAPRLARRPTLLGVIPLGTANDFARTLNIPADLDAAAAIAAGPRWRAIDLARANDAHFLNVASIGLSVVVARTVTSELKRRLGSAAYAFAGLRAFFGHSTFRARLSAPDMRHEGQAHQVVVANGRYYGGGVLVAQDSTLDDGALTAYTLGTRGRWQLLSTVALLRLQIPLDQPGDFYLRARTLRVETDPQLPVNLDGEVRTTTPVEFAVEQGVLRVLTPDEPAVGSEREAQVIGV